MTESWWRGDGGDSYTQRNKVNWYARIPFWLEIMDKTKAHSVFELGCNVGANLRAIRHAHLGSKLVGYDVNESATTAAQSHGLNVRLGNIDEALKIWGHSAFDLTFTCGMLIHVGPDAITETMQKLLSLSDKYVLAVEYAAETEEALEYRGEQGLLWKRDFGKLYENLGAKLVETGDAGEGFDQCQFWLLSK